LKTVLGALGLTSTAPGGTAHCGDSPWKDVQLDVVHSAPERPVHGHRVSNTESMETGKRAETTGERHREDLELLPEMHMPRSKLQAQPMPLLGPVQSWQLRKAAHEGQHVPLLTRDTGH
jgi:hypothetical protein